MNTENIEQELNKMKDQAGSFIQKAQDFIKENPLTSFAVAGAALGAIVVGSLKSKSKEEKNENDNASKEGTDI